jgi:agmatine deiminase
MNRRSAPASERTAQRGLIVALCAAIVVVLAIGVRILTSHRPEPPAEPAAPAADQLAAQGDFYLPAEFDPQDLLYVAAEQLAERFPDILTAVLGAVGDEVPVTLLVGSAQGKAAAASVLSAGGSASGKATIVQVPLATMWLRDCGPFTVTDAQGKRSMVEFRSGQRRCGRIDDGVPAHLAIRHDYAILKNPLLLEGGDVSTNGRGLGVLSTRVVDQNASFCDIVPSCIARTVAALLGFEQVLLLPPLAGEPTGHLDQACVFVAPDLAVVGLADRKAKELHDSLEKIALDLEGLPTEAGPLRVERIPYPAPDDGVWRSYTTVVFAGGALLVPIYPDHCPDLDAEALALYRQLLPGRRIVGIDVGALARAGGDLHSLMVSVPIPAPLAAPDPGERPTP